VSSCHTTRSRLAPLDLAGDVKLQLFIQLAERGGRPQQGEQPGTEPTPHWVSYRQVIGVTTQDAVEVVKDRMKYRDPFDARG
jgi:hypothetical protein